MSRVGGLEVVDDHLEESFLVIVVGGVDDVAEDGTAKPVMLFCPGETVECLDDDKV